MPLPEAKGLEAALKLKDATPKAKDATPKAKEADPKSKEVNPKATNPLISQPGNKDDPLPAKAQFRIFSFTYCYLFIFVCNFPLLWQFAMFKMYLFS